MARKRARAVYQNSPFPIIASNLNAKPAGSHRIWAPRAFDVDFEAWIVWTKLNLMRIESDPVSAPGSHEPLTW